MRKGEFEENSAHVQAEEPGAGSRDVQGCPCQGHVQSMAMDPLERDRRIEGSSEDEKCSLTLELLEKTSLGPLKVALCMCCSEFNVKVLTNIQEECNHSIIFCTP